MSGLAWYHVETGGGCDAIRAEVDDAWELLCTDWEEANYSPNAGPYCVGLYRLAEDGYGVWWEAEGYAEDRAEVDQVAAELLRAAGVEL